MSLWKRGHQYWTDFTVEGVRYRKSLETTKLQEAKQWERVVIDAARRQVSAPYCLSSQHPAASGLSTLLRQFPPPPSEEAIPALRVSVTTAATSALVAAAYRPAPGAYV